jgi:hypothetical protein
MFGFSRDAQLQAIVFLTQADVIKHLLKELASANNKNL